ncbi:MAG: alpha-hydroxy acid oxidase [Ilumatobacteraceae bacterium]|nr:alpha-hydroxy acid oxidase [Ilumatobacteraceae bacterium]
MKPFISVTDARRRARRALPSSVFDVVDGGSDDEVTMRRNREAFEGWSVSQRVGVEFDRADLTTTLHGNPLAAPVVFAPCGLTGLVHPDGELAVARVASRRGTLAMFSTFSTHSLETIALAASGPKWFQLYFLGGRAGADQLVARAETAGFTGLVITLDTSVVGNRERDLAHGISYPMERDVGTVARLLPQLMRHPRWLGRFLRAGLPMDMGNASDPGAARDRRAASDMAAGMFESPPGWPDVERLRERWGGTLVVKGVLDPRDARRAVELGADVVVVSNHGGRQLGSAMGTLQALPAVVAEVGDSVEVVLDGGVRRGTDVVKALALGARAVAIGRPYLYGLGVGGEQGVEAVWSVLVDGLARDMRLAGCPSVRQLSGEWIQRCPEPRSNEPSAMRR